MDSQPQRPQDPTEPFVRQRRVAIEPLVSAALLVALVLTINLWQPSNGSEARPLATEQATAREDSPRI